MIDKKNYNSSGQDCNFLSKVPNAAHSKIKNDKPGPGEYKIVKSIEAATNAHKRSNSEG
jgi:hypothetical protein